MIMGSFFDVPTVLTSVVVVVVASSAAVTPGLHMRAIATVPVTLPAATTFRSDLLRTANERIRVDGNAWQMVCGTTASLLISLTRALDCLDVS